LAGMAQLPNAEPVPFVLFFAWECSVIINFSSLWLNTWDNQLKRRKSFFWFSFRVFSPWSLGPVALDLWCHITSWWKTVAEEVYLSYGSKEAKRKRMEPGSQYPCQGYSSNNLTSFY
jgi:hypothetical protein